MGANTKEFTDANFKTDVLGSSTPVLVDFWAPWCGPCRQIAPMIEQLADENLGSVVVGKMNIDDSPITPQAYDVQSIPTLILFKDGQAVQRVVGAKPKSTMQSILDAAKG